MTTIFFHYTEKGIRINNGKKIKRFIAEIFKEQKFIPDRVDYIFCSDKYLLQLNRKFLSHDYYTDVLTFSLNEENSQIIGGEIYISIERVKENAKKYNVSIKDEILRVIFHGVLHLCGFNDKTKKDYELMRIIENKYLSEFKKY